jgi:hypothetical protein
MGFQRRSALARGGTQIASSAEIVNKFDSPARPTTSVRIPRNWKMTGRAPRPRRDFLSIAVGPALWFILLVVVPAPLVLMLLFVERPESAPAGAEQKIDREDTAKETESFRSRGRLFPADYPPPAPLGPAN